MWVLRLDIKVPTWPGDQGSLLGKRPVELRSERWPGLTQAEAFMSSLANESSVVWVPVFIFLHIYKSINSIMDICFCNFLTPHCSSDLCMNLHRTICFNWDVIPLTSAICIAIYPRPCWWHGSFPVFHFYTHCCSQHPASAWHLTVQACLNSPVICARILVNTFHHHFGRGFLFLLIGNKILFIKNWYQTKFIY